MRVTMTVVGRLDRGLERVGLVGKADLLDPPFQAAVPFHALEQDDRKALLLGQRLAPVGVELVERGGKGVESFLAVLLDPRELNLGAPLVEPPSEPDECRVVPFRTWIRRAATS